MSIFAQNEIGAAVTIWILSAIFSLASMFWAPWAEGCLWLTLVILAKVVLVELCRRFIAAGRSSVDLSGLAPPLRHGRSCCLVSRGPASRSSAFRTGARPYRSAPRRSPRTSSSLLPSSCCSPCA